MAIDILMKKDYIQELKNILNNEEVIEMMTKDSRYSEKFNFDFTVLNDDEISKLIVFLKEKKIRTSVMILKNYLDVKNNKDTLIKDLRIFENALKDKIKATKNKWIFNTNSDILAYYVDKIEYVRPSRSSGDEPFVKMSVLANEKTGFGSYTIFFSSDNVINKTIDSILLNKGYTIENDELIEDYKQMERKFLEEKDKEGKQYLAFNNIIQADNKYNRNRSSRIEQSVIKANMRVVNDELISGRDYKFRKVTDYWSDEPEQEIYSIPCHPFLYCYSLTTYEFVYVHICSLKEYVYDDNLRNKLILPKTHRDLLDILTQDLNILSGDIVQGKSTGTTILCQGVPGTGKTLTAECYSEITHRPLYKISSGQLGITSGQVEENLEIILKRAERWNAVLLIDEADVYIRERGNDINQNAVVAAILRTLEYFNGLLFMTTNRICVDDAILSRCIATIKYEIPTKNDAHSIWKVLSNEFNVNLSDNLIGDLVNTFPEASGRDIKELIRLTGRFCTSKSIEINRDAFVSCAQFRGIKATEI